MTVKNIAVRVREREREREKSDIFHLEKGSYLIMRNLINKLRCLER